MIIATHNGKFHADDVFGVSLLKQLYPDAVVVRSRDEAVLGSADIVLDVGGRYVPDEGRFDHHQRGAGERANGIAYSAFGLLWQHYGLQFCDGDESVFRRIDSRLVEGIDAVDNGQEIYTLNDFGTKPFDLSSVLDLFNPISSTDEEFDTQFELATVLATQILIRLRSKYAGDAAAELEFVETYQKSSDPRFVVLERFVPHGRAASAQPELLFTVFPNTNGGWSIQTVKPADSKFGSRKLLPESWRGLNGAELAAVTGVAGSVFCHKAGFIGAADTREGALELLALALAE
ncbi:uncharacterized UPF0160 family protein [Rhodococcus sp. 27YEA15]|uniref:MYG1 family protein n=1 Tax=Rhodococcus sp. 27YEA15 TaxID=3156259 RepID=UPI003C7EBB31